MKNTSMKERMTKAQTGSVQSDEELLRMLADSEYDPTDEELQFNQFCSDVVFVDENGNELELEGESSPDDEDEE